MGSFRQDKINEETSREITEILRTVKDPRISQAFVSITGCEVTKDLSYAKVYYSVLGKDEGVNKGLASAAGYIRKELAARLNLRITPKLVFIPDHSAENALHISEMLKNIKYSEDSE
jgi:ribosome-binding factor A